MLTLRPPSTTIVPLCKQLVLDLDETPNNLASHPDPSSDSSFTKFKQDWSTLKIEAEKKFSRQLFIWQAKG